VCDHGGRRHEHRASAIYSARPGTGVGLRRSVSSRTQEPTACARDKAVRVGQPRQLLRGGATQEALHQGQAIGRLGQFDKSIISHNRILIVNRRSARLSDSRKHPYIHEKCALPLVRPQIFLSQVQLVSAVATWGRKTERVRCAQSKANNASSTPHPNQFRRATYETCG